MYILTFLHLPRSPILVIFTSSFTGTINSPLGSLPAGLFQNTRLISKPWTIWPNPGPNPGPNHWTIWLIMWHDQFNMMQNINELIRMIYESDRANLYFDQYQIQSITRYTMYFSEHLSSKICLYWIGNWEMFQFIHLKSDTNPSSPIRSTPDNTNWIKHREMVSTNHGKMLTLIMKCWHSKCWHNKCWLGYLWWASK